MGKLKVDSGYDDGYKRGSQEQSNAASSQGSAVTRRHRAWLQRGRSTTEKDSWKPKKFHRLSAKHWLASLDSQLRVSTHVGGLRFFQMDTQDEAWSTERWSEWPWLGISMDQGSDGLSAAFALQNFFSLNCSLFFDFSHGGHKDLQAALRACHLMDFILLYMVSANLMHGPNKDDARFNQARACMKKAYAELDESTPLFAAVVPAIADELMREGVTFPKDTPLEQEVWDHLKGSDTFARKGYQLNLNRFMGVVDVASKEVLPRWSTDCWERTFLAIEMGWLQGAAVSKLILRPGEGEAMDEAHRPVTHSVTLEDRSLRFACRTRW